LISDTSWGNALLGTAAVGKKAWAIVIPCAVAMLILEELRKWLARRKLFNSLHNAK